MTKLKITVLKRQDPKDIFDEYPVKERDWFVPCGIYEDGQEFILESTSMPEGFCGSAWQTIYPMLEPCFSAGTSLISRRRESPLLAAPTGCVPSSSSLKESDYNHTSPHFFVSKHAYNNRISASSIGVSTRTLLWFLLDISEISHRFRG